MLICTENCPSGDADTGEEILEIEVRGKTGYGPCKSMPGAVEPYRRLLARAKPLRRGRKVERKWMERRGEAIPPVVLEYPKRTDLLFPSNHTDLFNDILKAQGLQEDREGQSRVLYSLRHAYICLRLLDGAEMVPKNRTRFPERTIVAGISQR